MGAEGCYWTGLVQLLETKIADDELMCVEFLKNMSVSADILAMAKVEVDLSTIPEGKNVSLLWCY